MPIQETFANVPEPLGQYSGGRVPISAGISLLNLADNPVLSLTAFLTSLVPPKVAQAAAQAAVKKLNMTESNATILDSEAKVNDAQLNLEKAGATAIASAAAKSHLLSKKVESEMQQKTRSLIEIQLRKMELKLSHFQELEACLDYERKELDKERHQLYLDRLKLKNGDTEEKQPEVVAVDVGEDHEMMDESAAVLAL